MQYKITCFSLSGGISDRAWYSAVSVSRGLKIEIDPSPPLLENVRPGADPGFLEGGGVIFIKVWGSLC